MIFILKWCLGAYIPPLLLSGMPRPARSCWDLSWAAEHVGTEVTCSWGRCGDVRPTWTWDRSRRGPLWRSLDYQPHGSLLQDEHIGRMYKDWTHYLMGRYKEDATLLLAEELNHCGLVMPYGVMNLSWHSSRWRLVAWQHPAITWTKVIISRVLCHSRQGNID